jgi:hypothetical protein
MTDLPEYGVSSARAEDFIKFFEEVTGVLLTTDALLVFLAHDPGLGAPLGWWDRDEPNVVNQASSAVAEWICGQPWPCHGDNGDLNAYLVVLRAAAITKGHRVTSWHTYST